MLRPARICGCAKLVCVFACLLVHACFIHNFFAGQRRPGSLRGTSCVCAGTAAASGGRPLPSRPICFPSLCDSSSLTEFSTVPALARHAGSGPLTRLRLSSTTSPCVKNRGRIRVVIPAQTCQMPLVCQTTPETCTGQKAGLLRQGRENTSRHLDLLRGRPMGWF